MGTALIIGYGAGLGHGIAQAFAGAGHDLALLSRSPDKDAAALEALRAGGREVRTTAVDAGDFKALKAAIAQAEQEVGPVEAAIYNVVVPTFGEPSKLDPERLVQDIRANVVGALVTAQALLPSMAARGQGTLLLTGGGWAQYPQALASGIALSKAALRSLAFTLNEEMAGKGLRVGMLAVMGPIAPGTPFDPELIGRAFLARHQEPVEGFKAETLFKGRV